MAVFRAQATCIRQKWKQTQKVNQKKVPVYYVWQLVVLLTLKEKWTFNDNNLRCQPFVPLISGVREILHFIKLKTV